MFLQITDMFKLYILNLCFIWFGFRHKNHLVSLENVIFWLKIPSFVATNTAGQLKRPFSVGWNGGKRWVSPLLFLWITKSAHKHRRNIQCQHVILPTDPPIKCWLSLDGEVTPSAAHSKSVQFTLNEPNYKKKQQETEYRHCRFSVGVSDIVE